MQLLFLLSGSSKYAAACESCLKLYLATLEQAGSYHCSLCTALDENLKPASLLVLRGPENEMSTWRQGLNKHYLPDVLIFTLADDKDRLPDTLNKPATPQTTAWLCQGTQCLPPAHTLEDILKQLTQATIAPNPNRPYIK